MKLLYCPDCEDVRAISGKEKVYCKCKRSWCYVDADKTAVIGGLGIPIAVNNGKLRTAISHRPETGKGYRFEAFVIPKTCEQLRHEDSAEISEENEED
jgi:hypothetical protein